MARDTSGDHKAAPSTAQRLSCFTFPEQIVVWSLRRISSAQHDDICGDGDVDARAKAVIQRVGRELSVALSKHRDPCIGCAASARLKELLDTFTYAGVRSLRLNPLCTHGAATDERMLLSFLAGCQHGDDGHVRALLSWYFPPPAMRIAMLQGRALASILRDGDLYLPQRLSLDVQHLGMRPLAEQAASTTGQIH